MNPDLTVDEIQQMHYSDIVGLVRERNRPSGGVRTVQTVAANSFLNRDSHALEIGSNTGFTAVNLCLLTGCRVTGIDVVPSSIEEATRYAASNGVSERVKFLRADATALPFANGRFDLVWASNVTSFIGEKERALSEYLRVLRVGGFLAMIPIYYRKQPPARLVEQVGAAIHAPLRIWARQDWIDLCLSTRDNGASSMELVLDRDYEYLDRSEAVEAYCSMVMEKPHLQEYSKEVRTAILQRYRYFIRLFNENLQYCGYSIFLFQRRSVREEPELFLSVERR